MATKRKYYNGLIPFNLFGDQLSYEPYGTGTEYIKPEEIINGDIWLERGYPREKRMVVYLTNSVTFDSLQPDQYSKDKLYIMKCDSSITIQNYKFKDTLKYSGYSRGRSAANFQFKSIEFNREYTVFLKDFEEYFVMNMEKGIIEAEFTFCKRGANFGLTIVT